MSWFRNYLLPGLVFQSVVIGGGYATGRELIEFFFSSGPVGGLLGLLVAGAVFGLVLAVGFEFARVFRAYDYRRFCQGLLGRFWIVFEIAFFLLLLLILSVIGSAAGEMVAQRFGLPPLVGTLLLIVGIGVLTFAGSESIQRVLAGWSILLYAVYALMLLLAFRYLGDNIAVAYDGAGTGEGWLRGGIMYAGYNLAVLPAVLFAVAHQTRRRQAVGAGLIAGLVAVVPAMAFYVAMMGAYPDIGEAPVPASHLMASLDLGWLEILFHIVVFGTFVETGTALLHAVNERLDSWLGDSGRALPKVARPAVAVAFLVLSIFAATQVGIVTLVAEGYSALTLVFIAVLVLPLLTVGLWKIARASGRGPAEPGELDGSAELEEPEEPEEPNEKDAVGPDGPDDSQEIPAR